MRSGSRCIPTPLPPPSFFTTSSPQPLHVSVSKISVVGRVPPRMVRMYVWGCGYGRGSWCVFSHLILLFSILTRSHRALALTRLSLQLQLQPPPPVTDITIGGVSFHHVSGRSLVAWEATLPGLNGAMTLNLATNLILNSALNDTNRAAPVPTITQASYSSFPAVSAGMLLSQKWVAFFGAATVSSFSHGEVGA